MSINIQITDRIRENLLQRKNLHSFFYKIYLFLLFFSLYFLFFQFYISKSNRPRKNLFASKMFPYFLNTPKFEKYFSIELLFVAKLILVLKFFFLLQFLVCWKWFCFMKHTYIYFGLFLLHIKAKGSDYACNSVFTVGWKKEKRSFLSFSWLSLLFQFILMLISVMIHYYSRWTSVKFETMPENCFPSSPFHYNSYIKFHFVRLFIVNFIY